MILNPIRSIWRADRLSVPLATDDVSELDDLEVEMRSRRARFWANKGWVGEVEDGRVKLGFRRRLSLRSELVLDARITTDRRGPRLEGVFRRAWYTRLSLTYAAVVFIGFAAIMATKLMATASTLSVLALPVCLLGAGWALLTVSNRRLDRQMRELEEIVRATVGVRRVADRDVASLPGSGASSA